MGALETLVEAISIVLEENRNDALKEAGRRPEHHRIEVDLNASDEEGLLEPDEFPA